MDDLRNKIILNRNNFDSIEGKETLWDLVIDEVNKIKENFSEEEINQALDSTILGNEPDKCFYGRMVGSCNDQRITNFITDNIDSVIRISYNKQRIGNINPRASVYQTPLETYIYPTKDEEDNVDYDDADDDDDCAISAYSYIKRINKVKDLFK